MTDNRERSGPGPNGPLYDLLLNKLPEYATTHADRKRLDIYRLASDLGISYQSIYQCLPSDKRPAKCSISVKLAKKLIELSEKTKERPKDFAPLSLLDFGPYLPS
ncbi:hypothetical protein [Rhizobium nepotum]|uniref:hypothetical protein n=1 Tax=Rhizobium nepotum TaxID=1035271 RepID=UPI003CE88A92